MTIHGDLEDIIRIELDHVERALKRGGAAKALRELDDAVSKLKDIARKVSRLEAEAKAQPALPIK